MNYGIPYMGSKSKIVKELIRIFPKTDNFYDLFGGGFSVTHAMLVHRKNDFKEFHFNEIRSGMTKLIQDAISGEYSYEKYKPKFVDRGEFFEKIDTDLMIKILWSFGNDGKNYLFSKGIEPYKKSMHNAIVFNEFDETAKLVFGFDSFKNLHNINSKRLHLRNRIEFFRVNGIPDFLKDFLNEEQLQQLQQLQQLRQLRQLQQLEQLERLRQLQQLQQLEQLERLSFYNDSYQNIPLKENSIVYCDIPYIGTGEYDKNKNFNHKDFYEWAANLNYPVFISEYKLDDDRFKCIFQIKKTRLMSSSSDKSIKAVEKLFVNKIGLKEFIKYIR